MTITERLVMIESKQKYLERLLYGLYVLLLGNLGVNII